MAKSTERDIFASQEQALGTRLARDTRFKEEVDPMCSMWEAVGDGESFGEWVR